MLKIYQKLKIIAFLHLCLNKKNKFENINIYKYKLHNLFMEKRLLIPIILASLVLVMFLEGVSAVDIPCIGTIDKCDTFSINDCPADINCVATQVCEGTLTFSKLCSAVTTASCSAFEVAYGDSDITPCKVANTGYCVVDTVVISGSTSLDCGVPYPSPCGYLGFPDKYRWDASLSECSYSAGCDEGAGGVNYDCSQFTNDVDSCKSLSSKGCRVQCTDSDVTDTYTDGINIYDKGTCTYTYRTEEDSCSGTGLVQEYKCVAGNTCLKTVLPCPEGYSCSNGACVGGEPSGTLTADFIATHDGLTITFNAGTSSGTGLTYSWDFGDDGTGTGAIVEHEYSEADKYSVVLTITDSDTNIGTKTKEVTVSAAVACTDDSDCDSGYVCNTVDGVCEADGDGGANGGAVTGPSCEIDSDKGLDKLPLGQRQKGSDNVLYYCSLGQIWEEAKPRYDLKCDDDTECTSEDDLTTSPAACISNYECMSNACADGLCFSVRKELSAQRVFLYKIFCTVTNLGEYIRVGDEIELRAEDYPGLISDDVAPGYGECMLKFISS